MGVRGAGCCRGGWWVHIGASEAQKGGNSRMSILPRENGRFVTVRGGGIRGLCGVGWSLLVGGGGREVGRCRFWWAGG
jgi:hypothetical protein